MCNIYNWPRVFYDSGKIIYESIKVNFLNNDQFWKDLGGRN